MSPLEFGSLKVLSTVPKVGYAVQELQGGIVSSRSSITKEIQLIQWLEGMIDGEHGILSLSTLRAR